MSFICNQCHETFHDNEVKYVRWEDNWGNEEEEVYCPVCGAFDLSDYQLEEEEL